MSASPSTPHRFFWEGLLLLAIIKMGLHLYANPLYEFHRDEYLYLALGQHPAWGYWSVPPLIGWVSFLVQHTLGDSVQAVRLIPSVFTSGLILLAGAMARELGAGRFGQFLAGLAILVSPAFLRSGMLFMPVFSDVCLWALATYWVLRYLNTQKDRYLYWFAVTIGFSLLNKYMPVFLLLSVLLALLISPYRRLFRERHFWQATLLALLIFVPNVLWQYWHGWPVIGHMEELSRTQLTHVEPLNFVLDQLVMNLAATGVLLGGLWWLFSRSGKPYRLLGWIYVFIILIFLGLHGKSYYTLGIYPMLFGAGGVFWEKQLQASWSRTLKPAAMVLIFLPGLPFCVPLLKAPAMADYCKGAVDNFGLSLILRWEDGRLHHLPQDYADMLGWKELARLAEKAWRQAKDPGRCMIYAENYGQAGAVGYYSRKWGLPKPVSFADSFRLWAPRHIHANSFVYINDELGADVQRLFADIQLIGRLENPYARERGTQVYLCQQPRGDFPTFWKARVEEVVEGR